MAVVQIKAFVEEFALPDLTIAMATSYFAYNFDSAENALYIFSSSTSTVAAGASFMITKIIIANWSVSQYTMVNTSNITFTTNGSRFAFAHNGYVYLKQSASPYNIYKFQIGNVSNVTKLEVRGISSVSGYPQIAINGRIYYDYASSNYSLLIANESTNEILKPENSRLYNTSNYYSFTPVLNEPILYYVSYGSSNTGAGFMMMTNYLATINNLSDPVTKTADKTMKITYVIQEQ